MSLAIGIVGLPNVGKSTLFNALTKNDILAANYPFATIEPNTGIVPVPDDRLEKLAALYNNAPIVPAAITFVDVAGLVKGASQGEGLGNKFLANIRECDAILHVVRAFENNDITHVHEQVHPKNDIEIINTELILADIQTLESRSSNLEKKVKSNPTLKPELEALNQALEVLKKGELLSAHPEIPTSNFQLLTSKPVIYVFNLDEEDLANQKKHGELTDLVAPSQALLVNAQLESELKDMSATEAQELLASYGQNQSGLDQVVTAAYTTLGLQSFLTAGEKEVRAWTIRQGSTAPEAAGVIHTDFQRGFIAADVVGYEDLVSSGSLPGARAAGKVRTEGKAYIMQPDDVVEFKFNV